MRKLNDFNPKIDCIYAVCTANPEIIRCTERDDAPDCLFRLRMGTCPCKREKAPMKLTGEEIVACIEREIERAHYTMTKLDEEIEKIGKAQCNAEMDEIIRLYEQKRLRHNEMLELRYVLNLIDALETEKVNARS